MFENKKLIIFDLDGTLAESKTELDEEMSDLLCQLLRKKLVAVISGGSYERYQAQFLKSLKATSDLLENLHLFPTCSTSYYRFEDNNWNQIYREIIPETDRKKILESFSKGFIEAGYQQPKKVWGEILDDRETQITFSALGQKAPIEVKSKWDPLQTKRLELISYIEKYLPDGYEARLGGSTSIDITKEGVNKAYGIRKIVENLGISKEEMLFIGDALFEGGNDYPVKQEGVECIETSGPEETKDIIRKII